MIATAQLQKLLGTLPDDEVVRRVLDGEQELYEVLLRRHNSRLYRAVRSVLSREDEVEDVMQETYVRAYERLAQFDGRGRFSAWLLQIGVREAITRLRRAALRAPTRDEPGGEAMDDFAAPTPSPSAAADHRELLAVVSRAVDELPSTLRTAYVLREIEGLDSDEVAETLELSPEAVRVRIHRARRHLQARLERAIGAALPDIYPFHLTRCSRVVEGVFQRIARPPG